MNFADSVGDAEFDGKEYLRKEQNDFGWDWSPQISPVGPWRDARVVQLAPRDPVHVNNVMMDVYRRGQLNNLPPDQSQPWVFNTSVDFIGTLGEPEMHLTLKDKNGKTIKNTPLRILSRNHMTITGSVEITEDVALWWPNGLGSQDMYEATVTISDNGKEHESVIVTNEIGFRTIVWNGTPITDEQIAQGIAPGSNWHFEINGQDFFAKGANLVPPDVFWARVDEAHMRELFGLAQSGNYNMLRVWSSGVYLADWIYDLADEMGLLLWSEFQFSDGVYSNQTNYLQNYEKEAYYNTRRLNHHPSLALWAGGNELESIINAFFGPTSPEGMAYQQIQTELLIKCVYANSHSISYIPSSTYNGYVGAIDFNAVQPQTPRWNNISIPAEAYYSDVDSYNYDASQGFKLSDYPVGRFVNEFGFISMPSVQTWEEAVPKSQLSFLSPSVVHHNNHNGASFGQVVTVEEGKILGMEQMVDAVASWYPQPNLADSIANFTMWCYSTQLYHADYYASLIASFRRGSGQPQRTLGSLYWQLDDLWAAPTWAAIESNNRPKVTYYATKDIYQPVIVWAYYQDITDTLEIAVTSDRFEEVGGFVSMMWMDFEGNPLRKIPKPDTGSMNPKFTVGAINSTTVATWNNATSLFSNSTDALLQLSVLSDDGQYTHSSYFHPASLKDAALKNPALKLQQVGNNKFKVAATKAVAARVWVDSPSTVRGAFDENGFWLNRGESKIVTFTVWEDNSHGQWSKDVKVWSVWNNYDH